MSRKTLGIIRGVTKISSIVLAAIVLLVIVSPDPYAEDRPLRVDEIVGLAFFPFGVLVGTLLAWYRERLGGFIAVGSLVAFYLSRIVFPVRFPRGPWFLIFTLPGISFLLLSFLDQDHKVPGSK